jgi:hypothetical protein
VARRAGYVVQIDQGDPELGVGHALFDTYAAALTECGFSREALAAANINPATGLATDYLNHFNEITMLIGLVGDMPDMVDELGLWEPVTYEEHFERSTFKARALAIAAYRATLPAIRGKFVEVVWEMNSAILSTIARLKEADTADYHRIAAYGDRLFRPLLARASGVIHGVEFDANLLESDASQATLDALAD